MKHGFDGTSYLDNPRPKLWDTKVRLGVFPFSVELPKDHPFYFAVAMHDLEYDMIADGTSHVTLLQADRNFLKNGLFAAWQYELWIDRFLLTKQMWIAYKACRAWAKYVRPELEAYKPNEEIK